MTTEAADGAVVLVTPRRAWLVWGVALAAYVLAVFDRGSLGVTGVIAQHRFGATAAELGLFGVLQLAVYAALQVPVGVLLDRFGSRRLIVTGAVLMALGQVLLARAETVSGAVLARVLVGAGDAMTFTAVLRLVSLWFAPARVPLITQLTGILGQVGQVLAAYPLVYLLGTAGWTRAFQSAAVLGGLFGALVLVAVRDAPPGTAVAPLPLRLPHVRAQLQAAWREPGTRLGLWTHFVTQFSGTVFALLWGFPFLVVGEGRTPTEAGLLLTVMVVVGAGVAPLIGLLAGRWPLRRSWSVLGIVAATSRPGRWCSHGRVARPFRCCWCWSSCSPRTDRGRCWASTTAARPRCPPGRLSSASGIVNVGGFVASLLTIAGIGVVLSALSPAGGATNATLGDFRVAMSVQYVFWAFGLVMLVRARRQVRAQRGLVLDSFPAAVRRRTRARAADR